MDLFEIISSMLDGRSEVWLTPNQLDGREMIEKISEKNIAC